MKAHQPVTVYHDPHDPGDFVFAQEDEADWGRPLLGVAFVIGAFLLL